ncbi:hypothetical protein N7G274_010009 [Stereocaulon virgatum]|uniref:Uncharacterized protein n=1 Tax=Stereocaulon virgatum TaxID=373712 RepID=A0ABR3ZX31_9LECA
MEEKEHLFSKNLSDLSTGQLKELCKGIHKSFAATYKRPVVSSHQKPDQDASFLEVVDPELSFVAKIDELHRDNHRLACEIRNWKQHAAMESDRRQKAESEAGHLKVTVRQLHVDNEKLKKHIGEWKSMAEESEGRAAKYSKEMGKIYAILEEVKSELPRAE